MTTLETLFALSLLFLVPAVVWLAVDTWALRRDVDRLDDDLETESDLRRSLTRRHVDLISRVDALEDARDTTGDLDVPDPDAPTTPVYRPVPAHFHEWR
ncbi:hypothetical protein [Corynebacterium kalidii]